MGIERDRRRGEPSLDDGSENGLMTAVHAVEAADGDGSRLAFDLRRRMHDPHSRASASSAVTIRSSLASSMENGPIAVRRNERQ